MKFAFTPFIIETNKKQEKDLQNFLCLKDDGKPLLSIANENLIYPCFYQDKWYVFLASNKPKHILIQIYLLANKELVEYDSIVINNAGDLLVINEVYIPRFVFEEREIEVRDGKTKKYDLITFDNEEESDFSYDPNSEEYSAFFEIADRILNPMENIKYADYIFFSTIEAYSKSNSFKNLNAIDFSKLLEKKCEVKEIGLEIENKPLRQVIEHLDFSRHNSFTTHNVSTVFTPEQYSPSENYLAIVSDSEDSDRVVNSLKRELSRLSSRDGFFRIKKIQDKTLIRFMTNPELFDILVSRINKEDFVYINQYI
jgi:hypothetical protein